MGKKLIVVLMGLLLFSVVTNTSPHARILARDDLQAWTYLVYLAADNNLDATGDFSLNLIKQGMASTPDANVIVLLDHYGAAAELLQVTPMEVIQLDSGESEPDTADAETLYHFLAYGVEAFPAEHYVVVI